MPQNRADLEPTYQDGRPYVPTGGLLNRIIRAIRAGTPIAGPGLTEKATPQGIILSATAAAPPAPAHPFQIVVAEEDSTIKLRIRHGALAVVIWPSSDAEPHFIDVSPAVNMAQMLDDPFGGTVGHLTLSASTTYGVWLRLGRSSSTVTSSPDTEYDSVRTSGFSASAAIITDLTHTDPDDDWAFSGTAAYIYIGRVAIDAEGVPTIRQHLRSDLVIPLAYTLPNDIVHPEA